MKVSYNWLREYVDFDLPPEELADKLALSGTEAESIEYVGSGLDRVVVGKIKKIRNHPRANNLLLCDVDVRRAKLLQIVCGARNMKANDKVPVALVGAKLPGGMKITKVMMRGEHSEGMLCAEDELGLGEDHTGIMILNTKAKVGDKLAQAIDLEDAVLDLEITPNRPDCLGMIGIAREVAALVGGKLKLPKPELKEESKRAGSEVLVDIKDAILCQRYVAKVIKDIKVGSSPLWMKQRLSKAGIRPINNIVDITNYILLETGQPLHAFDLKKLADKKIIVRKAKKGEDILTLDEIDRQLDSQTLVIADSKGPIALAGVMGGASSEISEVTTEVLLESANFKPQNIMRTSRMLGLISESSIRFEKGVDPNITGYAANRAAELIQKLAQGKVLKGSVDVYPKKEKPWTVILRPERLNSVLGTNISATKISGILKSLELKVEKPTQVTKKAATKLRVTVPTFRADLGREIDLVEEVARLYGLNQIQSKLPESSGKKGGLSQSQSISKLIKDFLLASGLWETINYGFTNPKWFDYLRLDQDSPLRKAVYLRNPITEDQSVMRTTLVPGLLETVTVNVNRGEENIQAFEIGRVFYSKKRGPLPDEPTMVGAVLTGKWKKKEWYQKSRTIDFFDAKGVVELLLERLGIKSRTFSAASRPWCHPGKCAEILAGKEVLGWVGELHPEVQSTLGLPNSVAIFELSNAQLVEKASFATKFEEISKHPGISLDIALVVDESVTAFDAEKVIRVAGGKLLKQVHLFDVYKGKQIGKNRKSLAFALLYQAPERTLKLEEVQKEQANVLSHLKKKLNAEIRS